MAQDYDKGLEIQPCTTYWLEEPTARTQREVFCAADGKLTTAVYLHFQTRATIKIAHFPAITVSDLYCSTRGGFLTGKGGASKLPVFLTQSVSLQAEPMELLTGSNLNLR